MAITVQKVSGAMRRAKLPASKSVTSEIRGWRDYTQGVRIEAIAIDKGFFVYWVFGSYQRKDIPEKNEEKIRMIMAALDAAGIKYRRHENYRLTIEANQ
jgi:hypothetical protein